MQITEIRVKLTENQNDRLKAFCSVTVDGSFVIRDLKVIEGVNGYFVAMPSRKLSDHCPRCGGKNHLRARFCNDCGARLDPERAPKDAMGRSKLHADVAHPINARCREEMQSQIIDAFESEKQKAQMPGYKPPRLYDDEPVDPDDYEDPTLSRGTATIPLPRRDGHREDAHHHDPHRHDAHHEEPRPRFGGGVGS